MFWWCCGVSLELISSCGWWCSKHDLAGCCWQSHHRPGWCQSRPSSWCFPGLFRGNQEHRISTRVIVPGGRVCWASHLSSLLFVLIFDFMLRPLITQRCRHERSWAGETSSASQAVCCKFNPGGEFTLLLVARKFHLVAWSGLCVLGSSAGLVSLIILHIYGFLICLELHKLPLNPNMGKSPSHRVCFISETHCSLWDFFSSEPVPLN